MPPCVHTKLDPNRILSHGYETRPRGTADRPLIERTCLGTRHKGDPWFWSLEKKSKHRICDKCSEPTPRPGGRVK